MPQKKLDVRSETGAVSFQGILVVIIIALIAWAAISLLPMAQTPSEMTHGVSEICKGWLKLSTPKQTPSARVSTDKQIRTFIAEKLRDHIYDEKNLDIKFVGLKIVRVKLHYTVKCNVLGVEMLFENDLNVDEAKYNF